MAWLALVIVLLQFALVLARYVFGFGSIWLTETVIYAHATLFMLAAAWTLADRRPCAGRRVLCRSRRRARGRSSISLGTLLLLLPFTLVLIWLSAPYAARSWAILERSQEISGLPLVFLLKTLIPLFAVMMALQGLAQAFRAVNVSLWLPRLRGRVTRHEAARA